MNKQAWLDRAKELGLEGFEITRSLNSGKEISWYEGQMDTFTTSKVLSTSMRALSDGKIVSVSLEKVDDNEMDEVLKKLVEAARVVSESEKDELVPVIETVEEKSARVWTKASVEEIRNLLASLEQKLLAADPRVTRVNYLGWSDGTFSSELTNSLGVSVGDQGMSQSVGAQITMEEDGELRDGSLSELVENAAEFDQDAFVEKLVSDVAVQLGARSVSSRKCPVIFDHSSMSTLFSCFAQMFSGSLIAKGISPLCGKLHEQIFSDLITVVDDPRNPDALFMQNYDDEGHPTARKVIVDRGVFEMVLHNTRSALKMNAESTGNGFKSGGGATDVSPMNMYIVPGEDSLEQLEKEMENGVVITDLAGMHAGADFITTNFSLQARGFLVENGKRTRPLTLITVAGNFLEMMKKVKKVGSDLEWKSRIIAAPSILFEEAAIGGNEE